MTTRHEQIETPGWDTKLRCACGFEAATKREMTLHLERDEVLDEEIAHAIETAVAYIEAGGDWEDQGQTVVVAAALVADLERIPAKLRVVRERETENEKLRRALDDIDRYTYGWSFGTAYTVIENIRVRVRGVLNDNP